jgi:hypothetical protein
MNKIKSVIAIFLTLLLLNACSTIAEGLGGSKKKSSDEFLVEKKAPLVLPPKFGELPEPGIKKDENLISTKKDISNIEEMINKNVSKSTSEKNNDLKNSIEESIIEKINKKKIKEVILYESLDETLEEIIETPKKEGFFQRLKNKINNLEH